MPKEARFLCSLHIWDVLRWGVIGTDRNEPKSHLFSDLLKLKEVLSMLCV